MITCATVKITERCNLDCKMCGNYNHCFGKSSFPKDMNVDFAKDLLKDLWISGCRRLNIVGGEPLMHPSILEILDYAQLLGYLVVLSTNGSLISESMAEKLREKLNDPSFVRIGIDSREKDFDRVEKGVKNLKKFGLITGLDVTLFSTEDIDKVFERAKELGVNSVRCLPLRGSGVAFYKRSIENLKSCTSAWSYDRFLPLTTDMSFRCPAESNLYVSPEGVKKRCPYEGVSTEEGCYYLDPVSIEQILDFDLTDSDTRKVVSSWLYSLSADKGMPRCFLDLPMWTVWLEV
jgi:Predicted Fe-S oxidoreductases